MGIDASGRWSSDAFPTASTNVGGGLTLDPSSGFNFDMGYGTQAPSMFPQMDLSGAQGWDGNLGIAPTGLNLGNGSTGGFTPSFSQRMLGYTDPNTKVFNQGMGGQIAGAALGIGQLGLGIKQYGLAKDQFKESNKQFDLNYGAQRDSYNTNLERRHAALVAGDPARYEAVDSYMDKHRIA